MRRHSLILLFGLGGLVFEGYSQSILDEFPTCADTCISAVLPESCTDASCICDSPSAISSISCCLSTSCSSADQTKSITLAKELCGSSADIPNSAGCSSSSTSTSSTSSTSSRSSISSTTSSCTTCTGSSASTATSSPAHNNSSKSGLSTGAKAGIGVGAAVGALLLVLVAILLYMLRRRRHIHHPENSVAIEKSNGPTVQHDPIQHSPTISSVTPEVDGASPIRELQATKSIPLSSKISELDSNMFCGQCGANITTPFCTRCGGKAVFKMNTGTRHEMDTNASRFEAEDTSRNIQSQEQRLPTSAHAFKSLVGRSIAAWKSLSYSDDPDVKDSIPWLAALLESFESIDALFCSPRLFWFFQHRESFMKQTRFLKFDIRHLDNYTLLPMEDGFINKKDCFYVSHFWRSKEVPDPSGEDFRLVQKDLSSQSWSHVWVDWTCLPQNAESAAGRAYANKMLARVPTLMRECGFEWRYPEFQPRLWILVEVAQYMMSTRSYVSTPDMKPFIDDVIAMKREGVHKVITQRGYQCSVPRDQPLLTGWLELLLIMSKIAPDIPMMKFLLDSLEPSHAAYWEHMDTGIKVDKSAGTVSHNGAVYRFTPFSQLVDNGFPEEE